jgi:hypothetical protein
MARCCTTVEAERALFGALEDIAMAVAAFNIRRLPGITIFFLFPQYRTGAREFVLGA